MANAGQGLNQLAQAAFEINDTIERTKGIEFNNAIEKWKQDNLLDKENGYFSKQGADAAGKSNEIIQNYDDFVAGWLKENKMSKRTQTQLQAISTQKRTGILSNTTAHDLEETNRWADTEGKLGIENAISNIVTERNNPDGIKTQLQNIRSITQWKGELQKLDAKTIELQTRDNISQALCAILDTKLQESPVDAKGFFNEHKEDINSNLHDEIKEVIKEHFYNDLFAVILNTAERGRTATEVNEIKEEKMVLLSPLLDQVHKALRTILDWIFYECIKTGIMPQPPEEIMAEEMETEFISALALAQKVKGISSIERFTTFTTNLAQAIDPTLVYKINGDQIIDDYAEIANINPAHVIPTEDVNKRREQIAKQQAEQQAQQQTLQTLQQGSEMIKNMGGVDSVGGDLMTRMGIG